MRKRWVQSSQEMSGEEKLADAEEKLADAGKHWTHYLEDKKMDATIQLGECGCLPEVFIKTIRSALQTEAITIEHVYINALKSQKGDFDWGPTILEKYAEVALIEYTLDMLKNIPVCPIRSKN